VAFAVFNPRLCEAKEDDAVGFGLVVVSFCGGCCLVCVFEYKLPHMNAHARRGT